MDKSKTSGNSDDKIDGYLKDSSDYKYIQKLIAENLRRVRKEKGWSQEKLAALSDVDRSYIGFIENCKYNVSVKILCEFATAMEIDVLEFFNRSTKVDV